MRCLSADEERGIKEEEADAALPGGGMERTPSGLLRYVPEAARPIPQQLGVLVTTWRSRAISFARESILLIYSALIDNTLVAFMARFFPAQLRPLVDDERHLTGMWDEV